MGMRARLSSPLWAGLTTFLGLTLVAFLVYWPDITDFFALDDFIWLRAASNPDATAFFRRAFSFPAGTAFERPTPFWRPLVDAYFFAAWRSYGLDPLPYHVTNVVLHAAVGALLAVLVWQMTSSRMVAPAAGLLFVILPTYDFAVTWISSVTELLGALLYVLTLVLYAAYLRGGGGRVGCTGRLLPPSCSRCCRRSRP